jgi:hypothetical protein
VGGILGRDITYRQAARATDLAKLRSYVELGGIFERRMVRPATGWVFLAGLGAAWARGWPILGFLRGHGPNWVLAAILIYLTIIPWIVFVFVPRGKVFRVALEEGISRNEITPALKAALKDPLAEAARSYELAVIAVLTWLMVARPF